VIRREHVAPYVGQRVVVRTRDGATHHGVLHSATNDGIYLRRMYGRTLASATDDELSVKILSQLPSQVEAQPVWWPFLFFPYGYIGGFWPWGLWW